MLWGQWGKKARIRGVQVRANVMYGSGEVSFWEMKFGGSVMKHDQPGRLRLGFSFHFNVIKNALKSMGEKGMNEKQENIECRSEVISCMSLVSRLVSL